MGATRTAARVLDRPIGHPWAHGHVAGNLVVAALMRRRLPQRPPCLIASVFARRAGIDTRRHEPPERKVQPLRTAYERSHSVHHAAVLVMRHDVYWRSPLPPLRADDRRIRLWLGFDCEVNYCWAGPNARSACQGRYISNRTAPPPWMELKHSRSSYFGMPASRCTERGGGTLAQLALCENTVLLDWWAVMSADLAVRRPARR